MNSDKPSREELRLRLKQKISGFRNQRVPSSQIDESVPPNLTKKKQVNQKQYNKLINEAKKELEKMNNDPRITPVMEELYEMSVKTYSKFTIPKPVELLNNVELATSKFKDYIVNLIDTCKKNNISKEVFIKDYLNSLYTDYHVAVLGKEIVPEKLRPLLKTN